MINDNKITEWVTSLTAPPNHWISLEHFLFHLNHQPSITSEYVLETQSTDNSRIDFIIQRYGFLLIIPDRKL